MGVDTGTDVGTTEVTVLTGGAHETNCVTVLSVLIWLVTAAELSMRPCVAVEIWPEIGAGKSKPAVE